MPDLPRSVTTSIRIYRLLLLAYPKSFRDEFGEEMANDFSELLMDALGKWGLIGIVSTWVLVLGDFLFSVLEQHRFILQGQLIMLRRTWIKPFLAGMCTTLAVITSLLFVGALLGSRSAALERDAALAAQAAARAARAAARATEQPANGVENGIDSRD